MRVSKGVGRLRSEDVKNQVEKQKKNQDLILETKF